MVISRGYGNFQGATEYSRGYTNDTDMVFSRGYGKFQGTLEKPRRIPYFTLGTGWRGGGRLVTGDKYRWQVGGKGGRWEVKVTGGR